MNIRKTVFLVIICITLLAAAGAVCADYSFRIPKAQITLQVESDGSMTIFAEYEFENLGQKLDFVDIGLPSNNYSLKDIVVYLNDQINSKIKVTKADYEASGLRYGITLEMGSESIPSGSSGKLSVTIPYFRKNLYKATSETRDGEEAEFVGFQFSPNYFNSKFVKGSTKYSFIIVFPPYVSDGDAYYYEPENWPGEKKPDAWFDEDDCVVYEWYSENADMHTPYTFGGKFNKSALTSDANIASGNSSSGNSSSFLGIDWSEGIAVITGAVTCIGIPVAFIILVIRSMANSTKEQKARAGKYFPPQVKTDGEGIKRGLTAVEAAILLETDLERVISMILYGLAKKNVLEVKSMDPLDVEIVDPLPEGLNAYETDFINALNESNKNTQKRKMREAIHRLILSVSNKVQGFSLKETREYYKGICEKAWAQVEAADTAELKSKLLGDNFGWAMLQDEPEKRVESTFSGYDFYPPSWWWRVDPGYRRPPHPPGPRPYSSGGSYDEKRSGPSSSPSPTPMPVLPGAMFARSITDGARRFANNLVGNPDAFKSAVKNRSNPDPIYSSSHRHGGGSSGGRSSCACACACDSCACACAGGGR